MIRSTVALLVLFALTAFAPAPFPKPDRRGEGHTAISLQLFQGKWRSVKLEDVRPDGGRQEIAWSIGSVRVEGALWTFVERNGTNNAHYTLVINGTRKPATIDFYSGKRAIPQGGGMDRPYMLGLIKRDGNRVQILYYTARPENRPANFENPPVGWWLLTLERMH